MPNKSSKLGNFHDDEEEFKRKIIQEYLPKLLRNEITIEQMKTELETSCHTIDNIVEEYYKENEPDNKEGIKQFEDAKIRNRGASFEKRESAQKAREEVMAFPIVEPKKFGGLTVEEQEEQIIMKVRKEISKDQKSGTTTRETAIAKISRIKEYFRGKNDPQTGTVNFSDQEIRLIIFKYPAMVKRSPETLEDKIDVFRECEPIGEETAYKMIKAHPQILGFGIERTKRQLALLEKEKLIDHAIEEPSMLVNSVETMETLINYAKAKHPGQELNTLSVNQIFLSHSQVKDGIRRNTKGSEILENNEEARRQTKPRVTSTVLGLIATNGEKLPAEQELELATKALNGTNEKRRGGE